MSVALVTGSAGLIGSEMAGALCARGLDVVGIDNDMRRLFFGPEASTVASRRRLSKLPNYTHRDLDIRDHEALTQVFRDYGDRFTLIVHTAAQPSHDWAARDPVLDFDVNAFATLKLLEATRRHCPEAVFVFTSTNKVYGDTPNRLPLHEQPTRWEIEPSHPYSEGIDESMSVDASLHSLFGASKLAADILVQEYGRYFGLKTGTFRCGCLTGARHAGAELHGFLAYLMKCVCVGRTYSVYGYKGKQVRDNMHSADVVSALLEFWEAPRCGEVYNLGGSRASHCSMLEAIDACEAIAGKKLTWQYSEANRTGDHIWYVSDIRKFQSHYPGWTFRYDLEGLLRDIYDANVEHWERESQ